MGERYETSEQRTDPIVQRFMEIDNTTLADLEIFEAAGGRAGVFELIARTRTSVGRAALRRRIGNPSAEISTIRETQEAVAFLARHPRLLMLDDAQVSAVSRYLRSNITPAAASHAGVRIEQLWWKLRFRDALEEVEAGAAATVSLFSYVHRCCSEFTTASPPPLILDLVKQTIEIVEAVLRVASDQPILLGMDRVFRSALKPLIEQVLGILGELDALNAMALTTSSLGWVFPEIVDSDTFLLDVEGLYHPFVSNPVANPARLSGGEPVVFLTGPNMAGKTTYLRSVALTVLLAQMGMGVPATRARLRQFVTFDPKPRPGRCPLYKPQPGRQPARWPQLLLRGSPARQGGGNPSRGRPTRADHLR